jgi:hypothetical protein
MGKPEFINRYNHSQTHPMELWQYSGYKGYGLPSSLYLLFWRKDGIGPYRLYSPMEDGIRDLFIQTGHILKASDRDLWGLLTTHLDPSVAHAAYSSIPTEGGYPGDIIGPQEAVMIYAKMDNARNYQVEKRKYVDDFLKGRPVVKVYFTIAGQGIDDAIYWFQGPNGYYYIDYSLQYQPDKLDLGNYEDTYYTSFTVDSLITDPQNQEIDHILGTHEIKLTKEQFAKISSLPFQLHGRRPIIPGKFAITMVVSNNVSQSSATFVHDVSIPDMTKAKAPVFTPLIPVRSLEDVPETDNKIRPFQFGKKLVIPQLASEFSQTGALKFYYQVIFPETFTMTTAPLVLQYKILNDSTVEREESQNLEVTAEQVAGAYVEIFKEIPLTGLAVGKRRIQIELRQQDQTLARSEPLDFNVALEEGPGIWKFSVGMPPYDSGIHSSMLGKQLIKLNRLEEAKTFLERAHREDFSSLEIALQLMRIAVKTKDYQTVINVGSPFETHHPRNHDLLWLMGWGHYGLNQFDDAMRFFERLRIEDAKRVDVLNLLADIYLRLDQPSKSLDRLKESLALNPNQKDIQDLKKLVESKL